MKRRDFFKNLIGGTAAVAIGPRLFGQIVDHEYRPHSGATTPSPENIFADEGLWVFHNDKLIAWSSKQGVSVHAECQIIDVTPHPLNENFEGYKEFIGGKPEYYWEVENLHVIDNSPFFDVEIVKIVIKLHDGVTLSSNAVWTEFSQLNAFSEEIGVNARFVGTGELTIYSEYDD